MTRNTDINFAPVCQVVTGGFFLVRWLQRPDGLGDDLLPSRILTLSTCLTECFPGPWALAWVSESDADRIAAANRCGVAEHHLRDIVSAMTAAFNDGHLAWPGVWTSLPAAQAAARQFHISPDDFALVELAVPRDLATHLAAALAPSPNEGPTGVFTCLQRLEPADTSATLAGWEVLGAEDGGAFHSWLCNDLHHDAQRTLNILPGNLGLLSNEQDARAINDLIATGIGAEPVPWFPAQLLIHAW